MEEDTEQAEEKVESVAASSTAFVDPPALVALQLEVQYQEYLPHGLTEL